jgi:hypothetical protein
MATTVLSRTISSLLDKKLVINNSQWAALLNIGTDWNVLRIGWRWSMVDPGASLTGTPRLRIGLLSNPTPGLGNGPNGTGTSHFVGIRSGTASWVRAAGPPPHMNNMSSSAAVKVGATETAVGTVNSGWLSLAPDAIRTGSILEISKGSPNYTFLPVGVTGAAGIVDLPYSALVEAMGTPRNGATLVESAAVLNDAIGGSGTRYSAGNAQTIAVDESTNGPLNAICIAFDRLFDIEFSEILACKMS